jgi:hypothetical protein
LSDLPPQRYPEITLTVPLGDFALMAKFDLLAVAPGERAVIIDWKTAQHIPRAEALGKRLQTIVYRYVLAKGGAHLNSGTAFPPEQIEMIYWYVGHDGATRRFPYDSQQVAADEAYLLALVQEISTRTDFPLTTDETRCRFCIYRSLHDRGTRAGSLAEWESSDYDNNALQDFNIALDQIAEIEF